MCASTVDWRKTKFTFITNWSNNILLTFKIWFLWHIIYKKLHLSWFQVWTVNNCITKGVHLVNSRLGWGLSSWRQWYHNIKIRSPYMITRAFSFFMDHEEPNERDRWKKHPRGQMSTIAQNVFLKLTKGHNLWRARFGMWTAYGLFYDQGTRSVSFEVKNDAFQICLILMFLYCR